jgi:hypothetical protein
MGVTGTLSIAAFTISEQDQRLVEQAVAAAAAQR